MSGWRIRVRKLYEAGGGPLPRSAFDPRDTSLGEKDGDPLGAAVRHGLVKSTRHKFVWTWELTQRGRDWCEGRLMIVEAPRNGMGRRKQQLVATWLSSLPREIRL